jgi:hypothetical protein
MLFVLCLVVALTLSASAESTNKLTYAVGASAPTASANTEFSVMVNITENTGFCMLKTTVTYDSSVLTYVGYDEDTSALKSVPKEINSRVTSSGGKVIITLGEYSALFSSNPAIYKQTGLVIALKFKVNAGAAAGSTNITAETTKGNAMVIKNGETDTDFNTASASCSVRIASGSHTCTAGEPVKENENPASCSKMGSYEAVTKCTVCGAEMSRTTVVVPMTDSHIPGQPTIENKVAGTCTTVETYDSVTRCLECDKIISSEKKTGAKGDHFRGETETVYNAPTCAKEGSFVEIIKCKYCKEEMDRKTNVLPKGDHVPGTPVKENEKHATCTATGKYDSVIYCTTCKTKLSSTVVTTEKAAHTPGKGVEENRVEPKDCLTKGSYDFVVYCSTCKAELSRTKQTLDVAAHTPGPNATETTPQICTVCQIILKPVIAHTHTWSDKLSSNADGHWYACSGCTQKKDSTAHNYTNNCDADCDTCGFKRTPGDHAYGNWTTVKEPTATAEGQRERSCVVCGHKVTESIPATGAPVTTEKPDDTTEPDVTTEPTPGTSNGEVTTEQTPGTTTPDTNSPEATEPDETTDPEVQDPGCGSAVSMGIALIAILGTALIMKKRD